MHVTFTFLDTTTWCVKKQSVKTAAQLNVTFCIAYLACQMDITLKQYRNSYEILRSQVVSSKQPKLGLTQEFVVLLVCMRWVVCLFVSFSMHV